ncbi:hypothetical protein Tco_1576397 [Tanacetum coccineum]
MRLLQLHMFKLCTYNTSRKLSARYLIPDTIKFKLNSQEIIYTIDMFRDTLQFLVETPDNPFIAPVNIKWDFINCVFQKKDVIQYPRFTKLIIADLMKKFPSIPLVSVYSTGNVLFRGMPILDAFLTYKIRATDDYAKYETVFVKVVVPTIQPQLVVSTQGTHRTTPSANRSPTLTTASTQRKKRKKITGDTSSPRKSLKVTIKQKQVVKGGKYEESYASKFAASMLDDDIDDSGTRIEPGSHKKNPEVVDDDDDVIVIEKKDDDKKYDNVEKTDDAEEKDNDDHTDHTLVGSQAKGSLELRIEHMQTPIPTPSRSPRINLSLDKYSHLSGALCRMCRRQGYMIRDMERKCVTTSEFWKVHGKADQVLYEIVPQLVEKATNDLIEDNLKRIVANTIIQERDSFQSEVPTLISKEFAAHAPKIIEELFKNHVQNNVI